jgi:hypothetical protein
MSLKSKMPFQVWLLTLSAFAIGMAEFAIAGVLPQVAASLGVTEGQAGNLITAYALAIVIGGPILTISLEPISEPNGQGANLRLENHKCPARSDQTLPNQIGDICPREGRRSSRGCRTHKKARWPGDGGRPPDYHASKTSE